MLAVPRKPMPPPQAANGTGNFKRQQLKIATFVSPRLLSLVFGHLTTLTYALQLPLLPIHFLLTSRYWL